MADCPPIDSAHETEEKKDKTRRGARPEAQALVRIHPTRNLCMKSRENPAMKESMVQSVNTWFGIVDKWLFAFRAGPSRRFGVTITESVTWISDNSAVE